MKYAHILTFLLATLALNAQTTADFENFGLTPGNYLDDSEATGAFASGNVALPNFYDATFNYWTGWAISSVTDNVTPGFTNQYSAFPGSGYNGSTTYALSYVSPSSIIRLTGQAAGDTLAGLFVTNSTYAYYSMKEGDAFAKKFGGITGDDPDFFLLTVKKYLDGQIGSDSVNFYLADYRSSNNAEDYLVAAWTWLDLQSLGKADSLQFFLSSSDNGAFGMNTPAYFCVDNVTTLDSPLAANVPANPLTFSLSPNPASDFLSLEWGGGGEAQVRVFNMAGAPLLECSVAGGQHRLDISSLTPGIYWASLNDGERFATQRFVLQDK